MTAVVEKNVALPDPDHVAEASRHVILWDGQCNFCRKQVMRLNMLDWTGRLTFLSLHDPRVAVRYPDLSYEQLMDQIWLVTTEGKKFGGADAMRVLSRIMPALWPLVPVMHFPFAMPLWRAAYRWIARRRYRLAGKNCDSGTCHLHS